MTITESSVIIRIAVSHHLHVEHAIELERRRRKRRSIVRGGARVFGASLESLQQCSAGVAERRVPRFLVDACSHLLEHVDTVGLFRKSGSVVRQRALRARLDRGEACLSTALPCDVACLLKQFCRELPEPLFPSDVHAALLKAQQLPSQPERTSATRLLSCLLPHRNACFLYYLLNFLSEVSHRCSENKMSSSNLAVVFAPCLLAPCDTAEGPHGSILLKADVVKTLIENAHAFAVVPESVMESVPVLLDMEEDNQSNRRSRALRALHRLRSPVQSRQRLPSPPSPGARETPEKRQTLRRSLGLETFPKVLVFRSYTLHTGQPSVAMDAPPSYTPGTGQRNAPRSRSLKRAESGKPGCFPFQLTRGGRDAACSPVLTGLARLTSTAWRRRSAL